MGANWPIEELGTVVDEVTVGYVGPMASKYVESGIPFLRSLNIELFRVNKNDLKYITLEFHQRIKKSSLTPGDVAIVRTGKPGTCAVIPDWLPVANCSDLVVVRCSKRIRPRFLCYWVNSMATKHINAHTVGAVQQHFNVSAAKKMKVAVPTLAKQDQVIDIIGSIDDRITLLQETNRTLEEMARLLFRAWFVDFEPVRAKMAGLPPKSCDAATAELFPSRLVDSELGEIPEGWVVKRLDEVFEINPYRKLKKGEIAPYLDMANVPTTGHRATNWTTRPLNSGCKFVNGDSLLAKITPCLENGKSAFVDFLDDDIVGWGSTELIVLRPKPPMPEYLGYLLCRHESFRDYAIQSMTGTSGRQRVQINHLGQYLLPVAPPIIYDEVRTQISPLAASIRKVGEKIQSLQNARDELLPRLMSGSLKLPESLTD